MKEQRARRLRERAEVCWGWVGPRGSGLAPHSQHHHLECRRCLAAWVLCPGSSALLHSPEIRGRHCPSRQGGPGAISTRTVGTMRCARAFVHAAQGSHTGLGVLGRSARGVGSAGGFLSLLEARGLLGVGLEQPQAHGGRGPVHGFACAQRALAPVLRPGGLWLLSPPSPLAPCARRKISSVPAAGRRRRSCGSWSG